MESDKSTNFFELDIRVGKIINAEIFEEFHLITNKEHQKDTSIEENQKVFKNITDYVNRFLEF